MLYLAGSAPDLSPSLLEVSFWSLFFFPLSVLTGAEIFLSDFIEEGPPFHFGLNLLGSVSVAVEADGIGELRKESDFELSFRFLFSSSGESSEGAALP